MSFDLPDRKSLITDKEDESSMHSWDVNKDKGKDRDKDEYKYRYEYNDKNKHSGLERLKVYKTWIPPANTFSNEGKVDNAASENKTPSTLNKHHVRVYKTWVPPLPSFNHDENKYGGTHLEHKPLSEESTSRHISDNGPCDFDLKIEEECNSMAVTDKVLSQESSNIQDCKEDPSPAVKVDAPLTHLFRNVSGASALVCEAEEEQTHNSEVNQMCNSELKPMGNSETEQVSNSELKQMSNLEMEHMNNPEMEQKGSSDSISITSGHTIPVYSSKDSSCSRLVKKKVSDKMTICDMCGHVCSSRKTLHGHMREKHLKPEFMKECPNCDKKFPTNSKLKEHLPVHSSERLFPCGVCSQKFSRKNTLNAHMRFKHSPTSDKDNTLKCSKCDKSFTHVSSYKQHILAHEARFKCSTCELVFSRRNSLKRHEMRHSGRKAHSCGICGHAFIQKSAYWIHMEKHHDLTRAKLQEDPIVKNIVK